MKKLALSLSGGGARAFCYFGFIRELEAAGIKPDIVLAHSGAAAMLCFVASGMSDAEIIAEYSKFGYGRFVSLKAMFNGGICSLEAYAEFLKRYTKGRDIKDLPWRTGITVSDLTDMNVPKEVVNWEGDLAVISAISCVVGGMFPLFKSRNGHVYADGGYTSLYSAGMLRDEGADVVVGLYPDGLKRMHLPKFMQSVATVLKSENSARELYERALDPVDLEVRDFDSNAGLADFKLAQEMYDSGRRKARELMPKLQALLN